MTELFFLMLFGPFAFGLLVFLMGLLVLDSERAIDISLGLSALLLILYLGMRAYRVFSRSGRGNPLSVDESALEDPDSIPKRLLGVTEPDGTPATPAESASSDAEAQRARYRRPIVGIRTVLFALAVVALLVGLCWQWVGHPHLRLYPLGAVLAVVVLAGAIGN